MTRLLILAGIALIVLAAALVTLPLGIAALGVALVFTGWASTPPAPARE